MLNGSAVAANPLPRLGVPVWRQTALQRCPRNTGRWAVTAITKSPPSRPSSISTSPSSGEYLIAFCMRFDRMVCRAAGQPVDGSADAVVQDHLLARAQGDGHLAPDRAAEPGKVDRPMAPAIGRGLGKAHEQDAIDE